MRFLQKKIANDNVTLTNNESFATAKRLFAIESILIHRNNSFNVRQMMTFRRV